MSRSPPSTLVIRPAVPSEGSALTALALRSKAYWWYTEAFMCACEAELTYSPEQIESRDLTVVVGEVGGTMSGFYVLRRLSPLEYELEALFVEPGLIGQGLGRALLEHGKGTVGSSGGESILVQGDPNAEGFYLAMGGERIGTRESGSIPGRHLPLFRLWVRSRCDA